MTLEGGGEEDAAGGGQQLGGEEEERGGADPEEGLHQEPHLSDEQTQEKRAAHSVTPRSTERKSPQWKSRQFWEAWWPRASGYSTDF